MIHAVALLVTACAFALLLIVNLGTTFDSSFLPKIYLIKITEAVTDKYITYGIYNSCLYSNKDGSPIVESCTTKKPGYPFDTRQFAELCGATMDNENSVKMYTDILDRVNLQIFQTFVLIMPAVIFAFIALLCTLMIRKYRRNNITPLIGTFSSLLGFLSGAAGLALIIATFWKGLEILEQRIEGLSHHWGPAIYLIGIGVGLLIISLVCFLVSIFKYNGAKSSSTHSRDTLQLYDYDINQRHQQHAAASSPFTAVESSSPSLMYNHSPATAPIKEHDSGYEYVHAITTSPVPTQLYPSYQQYQDPYMQQQHQQPHVYHPPPNGNYF